MICRIGDRCTCGCRILTCCGRRGCFGSTATSGGRRSVGIICRNLLADVIVGIAPALSTRRRGRRRITCSVARGCRRIVRGGVTARINGGTLETRIVDTRGIGIRAAMTRRIVGSSVESSAIHYCPRVVSMPRHGSIGVCLPNGDQGKEETCEHKKLRAMR